MTTKPKAIAQIETALAARPTNGPWRAEELEAMDGTFFPSFTAMPMGRAHRNPQVDANYIAACNPVAMREVVAHIAALEAEIERLKDVIRPAFVLGVGCVLHTLEEKCEKR